MAFTIACFLLFHSVLGLALASGNNTQSSINNLFEESDSSGGFTVTVNLNLTNPLNASANGTYNVTTGYFDYIECNNTQISQLIRAVTDAVSLAAETFTNGELKIDASNQINFDSQAAIDYFGPPSRNQAFQSNIQSMQCSSFRY